MLKRTVFAAVLAAAGITAAYGQSTAFTTVSAGNWGPIVAPDSIVAGFGSNFNARIFTAASQPLPMTLGGVSVSVADSGKAAAPTPLLMTSPQQVNYLIPATSAVGAGQAIVTASGGAQSSGTVLISNVAPAIFTANGNGAGTPAAQVFRLSANGSTSLDTTYLSGGNSYGTKPISLSPASDQVFLMLYGTGIRKHSLNPVQASINGTKAPVTYAGPVAAYAGLDQINIGPLPQSLAGTGKGDVNLVVTVDGVPANTVTVNIQ